MKATIGVDRSPLINRQSTLARRAALAVSVGAASAPMQARTAMRNSGREAQKAQMLASVGGPAAANCSPSGCVEPIDPRVMRSIVESQQGTVMTKPLGVNVDDATWNGIVAAINASKYCPSPRRVGWQPSSLTFQSLAVADQATVDVTVTPAQAFCMDAMVAAAGTTNDPAFTIESLTYNGLEYVTNGPWFGRFYTADAACCLCVRELPIIEPNTSVVMSLRNDNGAAADLRVQIFGEELFC